jgi:transposase
VADDVHLEQGLSIGAIWTLYSVAKQLGLIDALGNSRQGKLALWQVMARLIDQGSRLSAVRLAASHAACDILRIDVFDEDDLYKNLDWLCDNQGRIEDRLFKQMYPDKPPTLYLYDVTSSYLEGTENELGAFGYNRDGKKGKRQIVIGLLCNDRGQPLSIEVFKGNTKDTQTFSNQIRKVADRFGGGEVAFVGDRGMIKSQQIEELEDFHYITAITKPQIKTLLSKSVIQMTLFDQPLAEVKTDDGIRYILRRNPMRAEEIRKTRQEKLAAIRRRLQEQNEYLADHPRAKVEVALRKVCTYCKTLKVSKWVSVSASEQERTLSIDIDQDSLTEIDKLDGCYVIKTDLSSEQADKETVHARYKDLALVEQAFRTSKTVELEMRPVNVRLEKRTRGHAFVVMLAYRIAQELAGRWREINKTVQEAINDLTTLCVTEVTAKGRPLCSRVPKPRNDIAELLSLAQVRLPEVISCKGTRVATRKKLPERRAKNAKKRT